MMYVIVWRGVAWHNTGCQENGNRTLERYSAFII